MTIYIDADACPVKSEAETVATRHKVRMVVVSNGGIRPSANPFVESVFVGSGPDEADKWIAEACGPGDVVVTGDIPLAAKCVAKGARVVKHNGEELTAANVGMALATRDLMQDLRSADPFRQGGGKAFGKGGPEPVSGCAGPGLAGGGAGWMMRMVRCSAPYDGDAVVRGSRQGWCAMNAHPTGR